MKERKVSMRDLRRIWATLQKCGIWFNGCTHAELERLYGPEHVRHALGKGWYVRGPSLDTAYQQVGLPG